MLPLAIAANLSSRSMRLAARKIPRFHPGLKPVARLGGKPGDCHRMQARSISSKLQKTHSCYCHLLSKRSLLKSPSSAQPATPSSCSARSQTSDRQVSPLLVTLERSIGARNRFDSNLWSSGKFSAEVYPDLPIAGSWIDLARTAFRRYVGEMPLLSFVHDSVY